MLEKQSGTIGPKVDSSTSSQFRRSLLLDRYSRQIRFAPFGADGQEGLERGLAVVVGCGALGTVQASLLARAGVGRIRLIDRDYVEQSNLQRQLLYTEQDAADAMPKAEASRRHLREANSSIEVEAFVTDLNPENIAELFEGATVVLDGTDNFETRMLINDYCVRESVPWIYGAAVGSYGLAMPLLVGETCFRCVFPEPPTGAQPTCETAGVLGPLTSVVGSLQAMEALKILAGKTPAVRRSIVTVDLWDGRIREIKLPRRDPACACCGRREFPFLEGAKRVPVSLCGRNAVQLHDRARPMDLAALAERLDGLGDVRRNDFALRFLTGEYEMTVFTDGRAIIKGTQDIAIARSLYSRYIGN